MGLSENTAAWASLLEGLIQWSHFLHKGPEKIYLISHVLALLSLKFSCLKQPVLFPHLLPLFKLDDTNDSPKTEKSVSIPSLYTGCIAGGWHCWERGILAF